MIPWVREKLAERRAKWIARNKRTTNEASAEDNATKQTNTIGETNVQETPNGTERLRPQVAASRQQSTQQLSTPKFTKLKQTRRCSGSSSSSGSAPGSAASSAINSKDEIVQRKERIKVNMICPSGKIVSFHTYISTHLVELKNEVIVKLEDDFTSMLHFVTDPRQLGSYYRLIRADFDTFELNETLTLDELKIENNETLLMLERRNVLQEYLTKIQENRGPTETEIQVATRHVQARFEDLPLVDLNEIFQQSNLQFDVRKVLISLAQASAAIIGAGPYANRLVAMLKAKLINKRDYQQNTLQCLVDMGFKTVLAEYALKISNGNYAKSTEWLIQNQSAETPPEATMSMHKSQSIISPTGITIIDDSVITNSEALLQIVRIYSHRDIPPTPEAISKLLEMGFAETDALNALKKTCNSVAAACEYLCGNRTDSLIELREGLAQDSPVLKSILALPQVQMGLGNPQIFLAFLAILENENSIRVWGADNDTTNVVTHILQKYHEEKHVMGINQFYGQP